MKQFYGVLRVVQVREWQLPATATATIQNKYLIGWLPGERPIYLITRHTTTIGRALSNDVVLLDPTVSREHARLVLDQPGWRLINLTTQHVVRVNGRPVPRGGSLPVRPQDILVLGSTMLQLIAPQNHQELLIADEETREMESLAPGSAQASSQNHNRNRTQNLPQN